MFTAALLTLWLIAGLAVARCCGLNQPGDPTMHPIPDLLARALESNHRQFEATRQRLVDSAPVIAQLQAHLDALAHAGIPILHAVLVPDGTLHSTVMGWVDARHAAQVIDILCNRGMSETTAPPRPWGAAELAGTLEFSDAAGQLYFHLLATDPDATEPAPASHAGQAQAAPC